MPDPTPRARLTALDGLRGLAAAVVVVFHVDLATLTDARFTPSISDTETPTPSGLSFGTFGDGTAAVSVFFVLSGLVLTLPALRQRTADAEHPPSRAVVLRRWTTYYARRFIRLVLPVWASIVLALAWYVVVPRETDPQSSPWMRMHKVDNTLGSVLEAMSMTGMPAINTPLWSLHWELLFSAALPVYLLLARARRWRTAGTLALVLLALIGWSDAFDDPPRWKYLPQFGIGVLMAPFVHRIRPYVERHRFAGPVLLLSFILFELARTLDRNQPGLEGPGEMVRVIGAAGLVALFIGWGPARSFGDWPPVQWLGRVSFSLYLVHEPVVVSVRTLTGPAPFWTVLAISLPVSLALAWSFAVLVEQPVHRLSRRIGRSETRGRTESRPASVPTTPGKPGARMGAMTSKIIWTKIDEAPALATYSLLPIVQAFTRGTGIEVETRDISLAGRILAQFPDQLSDDQRVEDSLAALGDLASTPEANIIKLPNISASVPQLKAAIAELQGQGYDVPDYPDSPATDEEKDVHAAYAKVLGSAVNPVLREGNSDRRAPAAVKQFAQRNPHRLGEWTPDNKAAVVDMAGDDFYGNEQSVVVAGDDTLRIELAAADGTTTALAESIAVTAGEIVDGTFLSAAALRAFYAEQIEVAKAQDLLLSLHLKATMMKVSDPVLFGHAVSVFFEPVFAQHADTFERLGVNPNLGLADLLSRVDTLPHDERDKIRADIDAVYAQRPALAMVDSDRGITNLHVPSDVIIDASLPVVIRDSGQMWNADGNQQQTLAMVPDRSYGPMYQAVIEDCKANGALDPARMGSVPNVGLMAQKAEEYGSHPTTFVIPTDGTVRVLDSAGTALMEHEVAAGDIWRMSRVKDVPIRDWVKLAVTRARATGAPAVFFLDPARAHDANVIAKVTEYLPEHGVSVSGDQAGGDGVEVVIAPPVEAITYCLGRIRAGEDAISVTGNVLRDYLTDLFPILELGTSAKMLSVVPLLAGGGLFETGAGGSAPKHVQQFVKENYLRWDSLGEFSALGASLEHLATTQGNAKAQVLADALDVAIAKFLETNKSPARALGSIDNRGSHFYFALYWAQALAAQDDDAELKERFTRVAEQLQGQEEAITTELIGAQGEPVDLGGYYRPDDAKASAAMRPSATLNAVIDAM